MYRIVIVFFIIHLWNVPLFSQITKAETLCHNVVTISAGSQNGFGFITGSRHDELFIVTAAHILEEVESDSVQIELKFYKDYSYYTGKRIFEDPLKDLALIVVTCPKHFEWKNDCLGRLNDGIPVAFIGKDMAWYIPSKSRIGNINGISDTQIKADLSFIYSGSSGAPLVSEEGIVGMILESDGSGSIEGITIEGIKNALSSYDYFFTLALDNSTSKSKRANPSFITDTDGNIYATKIMEDGKQWMITNLNLKTNDSWCYEHQTINCDQYGRLYNWEAAQEACFLLGEGWRLPTDDEWRILATTYGGYRVKEGGEWGDKGDPSAAYNALTKGGNNFGASHGGLMDSKTEKFLSIRVSGSYWSSTAEKDTMAWYYLFNSKGNSPMLNRASYLKKDGHSVRCIKDQ